MTRQYRVPFGEKELIFQVPRHFKTFLAEAGKAAALQNPHLEVRRAFDNPIGSAPIMVDKDGPDLLIVPHALLTLPVVKMKTNKTDTGKDG